MFQDPLQNSGSTVFDPHARRLMRQALNGLDAFQPGDLFEADAGSGKFRGHSAAAAVRKARRAHRVWDARRVERRFLGGVATVLVALAFAGSAASAPIQPCKGDLLCKPPPCLNPRCK